MNEDVGIVMIIFEKICYRHLLTGFLEILKSTWNNKDKFYERKCLFFSFSYVSIDIATDLIAEYL